jgi:hypothetical protein
MKTVLVFKTSVSSQSGIDRVKHLLNDLLHENERWNFDLEDCDRILRVEAFHIKASTIEEQLKKAGFMCAELPD